MVAPLTLVILRWTAKKKGMENDGNWGWIQTGIFTTLSYLSLSLCSNSNLQAKTHPRLHHLGGNAKVGSETSMAGAASCFTEHTDFMCP